ncbi:MAG: hypothetical protein IJ233_01285, partial [Pyramidobacter sp.]|nr:hypothetical protein [Pyramidobacter sp.]
SPHSGQNFCASFSNLCPHLLQYRLISITSVKIILRAQKARLVPHGTGSAGRLFAVLSEQTAIL